jgi:hypothetical protein
MAGRRGKLLLVYWISGIVTFPGYYLRRGGVSVEDLNGFPILLKRKLKCMKLTSIALLAVIILFFVIGRIYQLKSWVDLFFGPLCSVLFWFFQ